ncbi:uncharacterized protein PODANS_4_4340 [Podospora anserina S mat+]|uniref:Podospora anserina S mat+ genomic DNA chromosome 4, supercontig 4 n=1 Tax=Podospora anserina (strain S / ATCC MYA-4624 / DSM 980 / FGSC 10383) TaxID=515849 RepID=B2AQF3_PODAN|nr:uncharacterized protein PODANS_4_4340 [Podospora anserina S mat+]CAP67093.1 unnamed protein product [Podospora anserina S mat+]CDP28835.1 Putative protein of unknown function [Podospora anserina S mat+]
MCLVYPIIVFSCHDLMTSSATVLGVFKPMGEAWDAGKADAEQTAENSRNPISRYIETYTCMVDPSFRTCILDVCKQNGHWIHCVRSPI